MIEVSQLVSIFDGIAAWLRVLADEHARRSERSRTALLAVYIAANESKSYVIGLKNRKHADATRESQLSRLWAEAAVALRRMDRELADKCLLVGESLAGSTDWKEAEIDRARDAIRDVFERARRLL